ncbi:MAG: hypothetical protein KBG42_11295 [Lachnospiraceae bacterium]|nr:hypothetical protein [Lachnospiraceae bacterium]
MTSQKSQNKITLLGLMREDLKHRRWMLVLSSFVQLLFGPVAALMKFSNVEAQSFYYYGDEALANRQKAMQYAVEQMTGSYLPVIMIVIAIVGALIVGIGGYRHLFNRRMTDMVNSVPVTRGKQFDSIYYNNWLIWFVPQLVSTILTTGIMLVRAASYGFGPAIFKSAFFILIGSALCFGCVLNLVVLAVVLSGTIFNALLNAAFIGFDLILTYGLIIVLCQNNFDTFVDLPFSMEQICWVSAPVSGGYLGAIIAAGGSVSNPAGIAGAFGSEASFYLVLVATIIVAIVNLIIAYSLYIKRKSEESESGVSNKKYRLCIRCINAVLGGLIVAELIEEIFYIDARALMVWQIVFAAVFCAVTFGVIDMVHSRSFKGFFSHWKQMIVLVLVAEAILIIFLFDLTGFDKRVISEGSIETARVDSSIYSMGSDGSGFVRDPEHEGLIMERYRMDDYPDNTMGFDIPANVAYDIITAQRVIWKYDDAYLFDPLTGTMEYLPDSARDHPTEYFDIDVEQRSGFNFRRSYQVFDRDVMAEVIEIPGFMENCYPLRCGGLGYPKSIRISTRYSDFELPADVTKEIFDATVEDFKENYSLDYLEMINLEYVYCLECQYYVSDSRDEDSYWIYTMNIYLTEEDARSVGLLDELGYEEYRFSGEDEYYIYGDDYYEYY